MQIQVTVHALVIAAQYGVTLDVPDDAVNAGSDAVLEWMQSNLRTVDYAEIGHQETHGLHSISGFDHEK